MRNTQSQQETNSIARMEPVKKRHHYVPEFYLKGFTDGANSQQIWLYKKDGSKPILTHIENVAVQRYFYAFTTVNGDKDSNTFENFLHSIESKSSPTFEKLKSQIPLNDTDREVLSLFMAFTMNRVPNARESYQHFAAAVVKESIRFIASNQEYLKKAVEDYGGLATPDDEFSLEELQEFALGNDYEVHILPEFSLSMIEQSERLAPIFYKMRWKMLIASGSERFATSDNPLYFCGPDLGVGVRNIFLRGGLSDRDVELTFPISRDIALLACWENMQETPAKVSDRIVREVNKRTVIAASKYVYHSKRSKEFSRFAVKYYDSAPKAETQTRDVFIEGAGRPVSMKRLSRGYTESLRNLTR